MASNFPAGTDTLTNPLSTDITNVVDHAQNHTSANNAVMAVQSNMGTNSGTNIHKNFVVGNFPARISSTNILQQPLTGTIGVAGGSITGQIVNTGTVANGVYGTATIQGGTLIAYQSKVHTVGSAVITGTIGSVHALDLSSASRFLVNMPNSVGTLGFSVSNVSPNQPFMIEILQGTAGLGTVNWFTTIRWAGSVTPTQTLTASRKDTFGFMTTGATTFDGYVVGQNI